MKFPWFSDSSCSFTRIDMPHAAIFLNHLMWCILALQLSEINYRKYTYPPAFTSIISIILKSVRLGSRCSQAHPTHMGNHPGANLARGEPRRMPLARCKACLRTRESGKQLKRMSTTSNVILAQESSSKNILHVKDWKEHESQRINWTMDYLPVKVCVVNALTRKRQKYWDQASTRIKDSQVDIEEAYRW